MAMTRAMKEAGLALLKSFEQLRLQAYDDATGRPLAKGEEPKGVPTIGWGHTRGVKPGDTCTVEEAEAFLQEDLAPACHAVESMVKVPLTDNQFDALVSFVFNVGEEAFHDSTLLRVLNAGHYDAVPAQLARWNKDNGVVLTGLTRRRKAEEDLWNRPDAPDAASATPPRRHHKHKKRQGGFGL
jgi:GH24 family phage-related lysozyme (muramidase)